ncbi:uncharacterized GPI-anchored protein At1g61900 isoform X1 [Lactuca sativa]|uniref:uncharacterized GPI-anchored protein At1g61900 isoform X1 n=1 Tax=Lactuca sativa TaxID=4236 RepID=UPI000CD86B70|nr:uncharacterized GPI-anchored protein At1g61900 isoform X1 [Lactuca sativa]
MMCGFRASDCQWLIFQFAMLLLLYSIHFEKVTSSNLPQSPIESPMNPQPVLPLLAPSPLMPFTNISMPNLSGNCPLNFSNAETALTTTAIDCWGSLAPYLANTICCPQLDATIKILIAQSSFSSGTLSLNKTHSKNCLSDITQLLEAQGSNHQLLEICSIHPSNLSDSSCPFVHLADIENTINIPTIIESCEKIDPVKECRDKICQSAITDAAVKIASRKIGSRLSGDDVAMVDDCKKIVLRWLASKFDSSYANKVLRGISSCKINKVCPLVFPDMKNISNECGNKIRSQNTCCDAMEKYMTYLQNQSFITNLQALNCAHSLAESLQKLNVSNNIYNICHIKLKDFSLQVGSQGSGCLFPSLPFDVTYEQSTGIDFRCDLNDNVEAPWPSSYTYSPSPINIPALPKATSDQSGMRSTLFLSTLLLVNFFT